MIVENKLIEVSKLYPNEDKYTGDYSLHLIHSGDTWLCFMWRNYVITGIWKEIQVFDINGSLSSPVQTITLAHGDICMRGPYLIVDEYSTLYIGGGEIFSGGCIYVMKMQHESPPLITQQLPLKSPITTKEWVTNFIQFKDYIYVCEDGGYLERIDKDNNISLV